MLLAVDIGNTNIVFGVFDGATLLTHFRIETRKARTEDEYAALLHSMFTLHGLPFRAGPVRDSQPDDARAGEPSSASNPSAPAPSRPNRANEASPPASWPPWFRPSCTLSSDCSGDTSTSIQFRRPRITHRHAHFV